MKLTGLKQSLLAPEPAALETVLLRVEALAAETVDARAIIAVPMTCAERRRVRRRLIAADGQELGLALPTGTVLEPGSVLHISPTKAYVVEAAPEEVVVIQIDSWGDAARVAHAIGNLHRDIDPQPDGLLALWDPPLELLLLRLGAAFERDRRPFLGRPSWEHP
ncbi:MAG: hypothetical protein SFU83_09915 [Meiothermus sp.]|nr:hypothetical protein [Meiothermus sp.]